jgi:hypothetical protein
VIVRPETPEDYPRLRELQLAAFAPSALEADIVDALRAAHDHVPELCLVARDDDTEAPPEAWMALALPAYAPHVRGRIRYAGGVDV